MAVYLENESVRIPGSRFGRTLDGQEDLHDRPIDGNVLVAEGPLAEARHVQYSNPQATIKDESALTPKLHPLERGLGLDLHIP